MGAGERPDKVRENRVRRAARRQGFELHRSKRRDPKATDYGTYTLRRRLQNGSARDVLTDVSFEDVERHLGIAGPS